MSKIDFKKTLKHLYSAPTDDFATVNVPALSYVMIDGHGDPNTAAEYKLAIESIYPVAYKLKFASKSNGQDYVVPPLEGLWWADDMNSFTTREKEKWDWTLMIMTPDWITTADVKKTLTNLKTKSPPPAIDKVRLETLSEGLCAQILHIGSYDDETETLARLHGQWLPENGYSETGKHHEIYLSDPRRTVPEKLRTILRQPIVPRS